MKHVRQAMIGLRYEPSVAYNLIKGMVAEIPSIQVFYGRYATNIIKEGKRVVAVATDHIVGKDPITFRALIPIEATHEGDSVAASGR